MCLCVCARAPEYFAVCVRVVCTYGTRVCVIFIPKIENYINFFTLPRFFRRFLKIYYFVFPISLPLSRTPNTVFYFYYNISIPYTRIGSCHTAILEKSDFLNRSAFVRRCLFIFPSTTTKPRASDSVLRRPPLAAWPGAFCLARARSDRKRRISLCPPRNTWFRSILTFMCTVHAFVRIARRRFFLSSHRYTRVNIDT